jgi:hypothetical protein
MHKNAGCLKVNILNNGAGSCVVIFYLCVCFFGYTLVNNKKCIHNGYSMCI